MVWPHSKTSEIHSNVLVVLKIVCLQKEAGDCIEPTVSCKANKYDNTPECWLKLSCLWGLYLFYYSMVTLLLSIL